MGLKPDDKLGPYQIVSALGKGGMGEVWRARDPRLGRDVAIKVAAAQFSDRFEKEARAIAALNHSNICTLFDVGPNYLVMELVEGPTLADRIGEGAFPLEEALGIARQIGEALEATHEKGIVHRDLKPANVKIRPDGSVKVLDFGLAKAVFAESKVTSDSPTLAQMPTQVGLILGTAAYMAPEQARGKEVDKRADIWSFGVVLHEMLTGRRLFQGEDLTETLAAVMKTEPNLSDAPAELKRLLGKCLQKDPKKRLRDMGDWQELLAEPGQAAPSRSRLGMTGWVAAGVLTAGLAALAFMHFRETPPSAPLIASSIPPPENATFGFAGQLNPPELSPDGKWIVFGARTADNKNPLWVRSLASTTAQALPGTDGAIFPFWSPDSRSVAFFADGKLKRIDITGGAPLALADVADGRGGSWSPQGIMLLATDGGPLLRIAAGGGRPIPATSVKGMQNHRFPWFLPDGRHFLFMDKVEGETDLRVGVLDSTESLLLGRTDSNAVYAAGHILFIRESTLMAQPFDAGAGVLKGEAVPVAEQISYVLTGGRKGVFTVSQSGLLVYQTGGSGPNQKLSWFDRSGKPLGGVGQPGDFRALELSPDGKSAAVVAKDAGGNFDIWIHDVARNLRTRFTFDPDVDQQPVWSPDGATIAWRRSGAGGDGLYRRAADGKGVEELLYAGAGLNNVNSWSPDGRFLLFERLSPGNSFGIWSLPLTPERSGKPLQPTAVVDTTFGEQRGRFSPDGRWVAYVSNESQKEEVYVIPFPGPGGKRQISNAGGYSPRWRRDGKEIFYQGPDGGLMAAEVTLKAESLEMGQARSLGVAVPLRVTGYVYDVSPDGQRILAITVLESAASQPLTLVQNWTAGLKK